MLNYDELCWYSFCAETCWNHLSPATPWHCVLTLARPKCARLVLVRTSKGCLAPPSPAEVSQTSTKHQPKLSTKSAKKNKGSLNKARQQIHANDHDYEDHAPQWLRHSCDLVTVCMRMPSSARPRNSKISDQGGALSIIIGCQYMPGILQCFYSEGQQQQAKSFWLSHPQSKFCQKIATKILRPIFSILAIKKTSCLTVYHPVQVHGACAIANSQQFLSTKRQWRRCRNSSPGFGKRKEWESRMCSLCIINHNILDHPWLHCWLKNAKTSWHKKHAQKCTQNHSRCLRTDKCRHCKVQTYILYMFSQIDSTTSHGHSHKDRLTVCISIPYSFVLNCTTSQVQTGLSLECLRENGSCKEGLACLSFGCNDAGQRRSRKID